VGGGERVMLTLAVGLPALGYEPVVVCPGGGTLEIEAQRLGIRVIPIALDRMRITANPMTLFGYLLSYLKMIKFVDKAVRFEQAAIIHAQHPVSGLYALCASIRLKIPMVLHVHEGRPAKLLYRLALYVAGKQSVRIICVSLEARRLLKTAGLEKRTQVIYNGISPEFLSGGVLAHPAVKGPGPHIGIFGAIEPRKAQHIFLEAALDVAAWFPTAEFWIVGGAALSDKSQYLQKLETLASDPRLNGKVHMVGFQNQVAPWMKAMDVVTLASVAFESFGMVLVEAMALGRAVVASRTGGTPEIIEDGVTGVLVEPGDPSALALALANTLSSISKDIIERARTEVETRFSPYKFQKQIADVYNSIVCDSQ
jgi:glycosyltransferase involved in cell wall biosynthesis